MKTEEQQKQELVEIFSRLVVTSKRLDALDKNTRAYKEVEAKVNQLASIYVKLLRECKNK